MDIDAVHSLSVGDEDRDKRTRAIIEKFRGMRMEFYLLKGVLCIDHGWSTSSPEHKILRALINHTMIAERMDELNREYRGEA